jgi:23S rRNA (guanosine2251-2'-O)-methyltransferase
MARSHPRSRNRSSRAHRTRPDPSTGSGHSSHDWLTGFHSVREALRAGRREFDRLWLRDGKQREGYAELADLARTRGVLVETVDALTLAERVDSDGNNQGVALRVGPLPELSLSALLESVHHSPMGGSRLVALDGVEDPQNVGALARVAESAGAHGLILTERRAPGLTPAVSRASAGAIEWLPVARVSNLGRALTVLQKTGYWVVAAGLDSESGLYELEDRILTGNLTVVLGAEGKGIRRSIRDQADHVVGIPMRGRISSLNVSTAGAIILYDLLRRSESAISESSGHSGEVG